MSQSFNDRMHAVNQRLKRYEIRDRINEHDWSKREPIKPSQSAQGKTINNLLYSEHGK
jgi:hypothetical protein